MKRVRVPPPISGGLMLSYKCSAACQHCMYACSPRWKADWITQTDLEQVLSLLSRTIRPSPWGEQTMSLNHFDNYGNFMPGYCGGISLGHWRDMERLTTEGIDLEAHPVLAFLIAEDIEGLFHFAQDLGYRESPVGYVSKCDLCLDVRRYLVSLPEPDFAELSPKEFYVQLD